VDVLHYCGHAFFEGEGPGESGLYCADGPLTHEHLRALPPANMPRLAFVNGCQGGRVRSTAPAASSEAQAFAEFFLRGGVDAYLGTFWVLSDPGASMFAKTVYRALIDGSELGAAVIAGRQVLIENGNPDWANYVLYGDSGFRLLRPASAGGEHAHH
jgi:CHAT domain-containing protein